MTTASNSRWRGKRACLLLSLFLLPVLMFGMWYGRQVRQHNLDHALIEAIKKEDTMSAIALLKQGVDANAKDKPYIPVTLESVLTDFGNKITKKDVKETKEHNPSALQLLYPPRDDVPKHYAEHALLVNALLSHGANPNTYVDILHTTLLHRAVLEQHTATVRIILEYHVNPNCKDQEGRTPLMLWPNEECARLLIAHGADVNARMDYGVTALFVSTNLKTCQVLLDHHADINAQTKDGLTALMADACLPHFTAIVRLLIEHGAKVSIKDNKGKTALDYAKENKVTDILPLLEEVLRKEQAQKGGQH